MKLPIWKVKKLLWHFFCWLLDFLSHLLGMITVFLCFYWLFHFETWSERLIYISATLVIYIAIVAVVCQLTKEKYD
ncbi:hypothetical protein NG42_01910 [Winslowiella iniecta]|uniref:Uncharacterized protein n=1 Tax=Winslowiella iniecta TaxID=1560201 RepID=A0A0L7TAY8_9GAMM|nr:hypothetical protein NG43_14540 [Winslowiella iniecta]KOC92535.1 hypothetical protein NG42_01910 [Winslowiella iniecta]